MKIAISIKNLRKVYESEFEALKGISLEVEQGDFSLCFDLMVRVSQQQLA